jgi:ABC-2 type transport system permease protein
MLTVPTAFDSWTQFYGNAGQMGFIVLVVMFGTTLSSELSRGTLTIMLSKGLPRSAVILSKLTSAVLIWSAGFTLSALTAWGYTIYMFPGESVPHLFFSMFCLWAFGVFLLAVTILTASFTSKGYACMLLTGAAVVALSMIDLIPKTGKYNPVSLSGTSRLLLMETAGGAAPEEFIPALAVTGAAAAVFTLLAVRIFSRRK